MSHFLFLCFQVTSSVSLAVMDHNKSSFFQKKWNFIKGALFMSDAPYSHGACRIIIGEIAIPRV